MPDKITFYASVGNDHTSDNPYGLMRRLETDWGMSDEALHKDFRWGRTSAIVEWERGDYMFQMVEVSHEQAEKIMEYFRQRWSPAG